MPAPGRLVSSMPKAMGRSSSGSKPLAMARYIRTKEMTIMMAERQSQFLIIIVMPVWLRKFSSASPLD